MIAKASTTCTYSLDPITLSPGYSTKSSGLQEYFSRLCQPSSQLLKREPVDTITTLCRFASIPGKQCSAPGSKQRTATLYFSRLLKNSRCTNRNWPHPPVKNQSQISPLADFLGYALWRCLGSFPNQPPRSSPQAKNMTGGGERDRTDDLMLAKHALSQLSYTPG